MSVIIIDITNLIPSTRFLLVVQPNSHHLAIKIKVISKCTRIRTEIKANQIKRVAS